MEDSFRSYKPAGYYSTFAEMAEGELWDEEDWFLHEVRKALKRQWR
jgi:hypothetical protein